MKKIFYLVGLMLLCILKGAMGQDKYTYWINVDYLECLQHSLPCECAQSKLKFNCIVVISKKGELSSVLALMPGEPEFGEYPVASRPNNTYAIGNDVLKIRGNTMSLTRSSKKEKYVLVATYNKFDEYIFNEKILEHIDTVLKKRNNNASIYDFVPPSSSCYCNYDLGGINLIVKKGDPKMWFLEKRATNSRVYLFEDSGKNIGKTRIPVFQKKLLFEFE